MENAFIAELVAGLAYALVGVPLLARARRTGGVPERFLGTFCLLIGASYVFYEAPLARDMGQLAMPMTFLGRLLFDVAVVVAALFNRRVFHSVGSAPLVGSTVLLVVAGLALSVLHGDWDGYAPLRNTGFWLEWSGQIVPLVWLGVESGVQWARSKRRVSLGLVKPMAAHRFLLWSIFAWMNVCVNFALVPAYVEFEVLYRFSLAMDVLIGALEMAAVAALALAFFPPTCYLRWLARGARSAA